MDTLTAPSVDGSVPAASSTARRIDAIDIARGIALVGMVMVHVPYELLDQRSVLGWILTSPAGRASVLFFVLSGVSLSIISGRSSPSAEPSVLVKRGVVLLLFGSLMSSFWYSTILPHYGVMFMLAPLLLKRTSRALASIVVVALLAGPVLTLLFEFNLANFARTHSDASVTSWSLLWINSLLFELYPLVLWIGFFVLGMLVGRIDLRRRSNGARLLGAGVLLAIAASGAVRATADIAEGDAPFESSGVQVEASSIGEIPTGASGTATVVVDGSGPKALSEWKGLSGEEPASGWEAPRWRSLLSGLPHADTTVWGLQAIGVALGIIGALILLPPRILRLLGPLRRAGTISLTAYVVHTFLVQDLWVWLGPIAPDSFAWEVGRVGIAIGLLLLLASCITRRWTQGPLEWGLHQLTRSTTSGLSRSATQSHDAQR